MTEATSNVVIADTNFISFSSVAKHHRSDLLAMLAYADHFAGQVDREERWAGWTLHYRKQLEFAGCELINHFDHAPKRITNVRELDRLSIRVKGLKGADILEDLARRSFKTVRLNAFARYFFQFGSGAGSLARFQVVPCASIGEDIVSMAVCAVHVSAEVSPGGLFNLDEDREMVVRMEGGLYHFSAQAYALKRDYIRSRLAGIHRSGLQPLNI